MSEFENEFLRRTKALQVIVNAHNDENDRGGIAKVARKLGVEPSYLQRCLYPPGKDGRKRIGDTMVLKISELFPGWLKAIDEAALQGALRRQFMDDPSGMGPTEAEITGLSPSSDDKTERRSLAVNEAQPSEYHTLSEDEKKLIRAYRQAGTTERTFILRAAGVRLSPSSDMRTELNPVKSSLAGSFSGTGADEAAEEVVGRTKNSPRKRAGEGGR